MLLLSTESVAAPERLEYWRDIVCDTFVELDCTAADEHRFYGALETRDLGEIKFTRVRSTAQRVERSKARIARSRFDELLLSVQLHGRGMHKQDGRIAQLNPGDFVLFDTTRPYELLFSGPFAQLVLTLPRQAVASRLTEVQQLTACTVQGRCGSGRLASIFIRHLARQIDALGPVATSRLHSSLIDLVATALVEQRREMRPELADAANVLTQRVLQYIDDHLADPDLSCRRIAEHHRISERYLRALLEKAGTCASDLIWARRLERARADLCDPRQRYLPAKTIGFNWGFKDAAHFSRAFKARFGCTPGETRGRLTGTPVDA